MRFVVDELGTSLVRFPQEPAVRAATQETRHERADPSGDQRILPPARARRIHLRPPRRQRRQARQPPAQRRPHHHRHARPHPRLHGAQRRRRAGAPPHAVRCARRPRTALPVGHAAGAAGRLRPGERRPAAQFPLLRQPAEISAVREYLQREMGNRATASASSSPTSIRGRRRCACSTPASATAPCWRA